MRYVILLSITLTSLLSLAQKTSEGVISSVKGKIVIIKINADNELPAANDSCNISKDISGTKNPFGIKITSGWMGIGRAVVTSVKNNDITIKVVKETTSIVVNGQKQAQFVAGKKVKVDWP